eukprot:9426499-Prorocentrum_lima.AAC.1
MVHEVPGVYGKNREMKTVGWRACMRAGALVCCGVGGTEGHSRVGGRGDSFPGGTGLQSSCCSTRVVASVSDAGCVGGREYRK